MPEAESDKPKGKRPPPAVLCLLICDDIIVDQETGKNSLIGLFDKISAPQFPARHPKMSLYAELTNGHGACDIKISLMDVKLDEEILSMEGSLDFPNPLTVTKMRMRLNNVVLPRPSEYRFQLWAANELQMERRLIVSQVTPEGLPDEASE